MHDLFTEKKQSGSQRNLRVGEEIRHALADIFLRGEVHSMDLYSASITVSEVRVSPDLKNATAFVMPLAGENKKELLEALKKSSAELRYLVTKRMKLRHAPKIFFSLDDSYDEAERISKLLMKPEVVRDLSAQMTDDR